MGVLSIFLENATRSASRNGVVVVDNASMPANFRQYRRGMPPLSQARAHPEEGGCEGCRVEVVLHVMPRAWLLRRLRCAGRGSP